jgi:murein DD-endopeptidase MepM/ murein hydrolase activator NlpD
MTRTTCLAVVALAGLLGPFHARSNAAQVVSGAPGGQGSGRAMKFDGIDDFIVVPDADPLDGFTEMTLEFWLRAGLQPVGGGALVSKWQEGSGSSLDDAWYVSLGTSPGCGAADGFLLFNISGLCAVTSNTRVDDGMWRHVAITWSGLDVKLYLDGQLDATGSHAGTMNAVAAPVRLGAHSDVSLQPFGFFKGELDEVRIWDKARSATQIIQSMCKGLGTPARLKGYWRLDEPGGQLASDSSAYGHHGTLGANAGSDPADPLRVLGTPCGPTGGERGVRLRQPELNPHPAVTQLNSIMLSGRARDAIRVEVIGPTGPAPVTFIGERFSAPVSLLSNQLNPISVRSIAVGGLFSSPVTTSVAQDTSGPNVQIFSPVTGSTSLTSTVTVVGRVVDTLGGIQSITVAGQPAEIISGGTGVADFSLAGLVLQPAGSPTTINVVATDQGGNATAESSIVTYFVPPPMTPTLSYEAGTGQWKEINLELDAPIVVKALEDDGSPSVGRTVTFVLQLGDGGLSATPGGPRSVNLDVDTDASGLATAWWTMGSSAVPVPNPPLVPFVANNLAQATAAGIPVQTVTFQAASTPGFQNEVHVISGDDQSTEVATIAPEPLRVRVKNGTLGIPFEPVTFSVATGAGNITGNTSVILPTDAAGYVEVNFELGPLEGAHAVDATITNGNSPAAFSLTGVERAPLAPTSLTGLVFDQADHPLAGVTCDVLVLGSSVATATTDTEGRFEFPALVDSGTLTLQVDGSSATAVSGSPLVGTYPERFVPVVIVPSAANELPKPVALPLRQVGNVAVFDNTTTVALTLPEVEGFQLTVHAGSMKLENGTIPNAANPVTLVLNQVHHDKLEYLLPNGNEFVFAFELEPAGAIFGPETGIPGAQAIDLQVPNVFGWAAGTMVDFYRFDPTTGSIAIIASGNVVSNGSIVATGAGSGIGKAGCTTVGAPFGESFSIQAPDPCSTPSGAIPTTALLPVAGGVIRDDPCGSGAFNVLHGGQLNPGVDITGVVGAPIVTVYDGTVLVVESNCVADPSCSGASEGCGGGYGNFVVIEHPVSATELDYFYTAYSQLETTAVNPGDFVLAGTQIGTLGQTGNANPACLPCAITPYVHFELSAIVLPLTTSIPRCDPSTYLLNLAPPTSAVPSTALAPYTGESVLQTSGEVGFPTPQILTRINNVAAPAFGLSTMRSTWIVGDHVREFKSTLFVDTLSGTTQTESSIEPDGAGAPVHIDASAVTTALNVVGETSQLAVTAFDETNSTRDVTGRLKGTFYRSSNDAVVTVSNGLLDAGLVTAAGVGTAYVTAINEGTLSTTQFSVTVNASATTVQGYVDDGADAPVVGAAITLYPGHLTGTTDGTGFFSIPGVPALEGDLMVTARADISNEPKIVVTSGIVPNAGGFTDVGTLVLEDAVYWIHDKDEDWSKGNHWSTGSVPQPGDNVIIDVSKSLTITINTEVLGIKSLFCTEDLELDMNPSSKFSVAEPYWVDGDFTIKEGTLASSTLLCGEPGSTVVIDSSGDIGLESMRIDPFVTIFNGNFDLTVTGGLELNGTLWRDDGSGGSAPTFIVNGSQTWSGTGTIDFSDAPGALEVTGQSSASLTIGAGLTLSGCGFIEAMSGSPSFVNYGTIQATDATPLYVRPGGTWENYGLLEAIPGARLELENDWNNFGTIEVPNAILALYGPFVLADLGTANVNQAQIRVKGTLDLLGQTLVNGGVQGDWRVQTGGTIRNGTLSGSMLSVSFAGTYDGLTLEADVNLLNGDDLTIVNGLTLNSSQVFIAAAPLVTELIFSGNQTLAGIGTISMTGGDNALVRPVSGILTIGSGVTVGGAGQIGSAIFSTINDGRITTTPAQTLDVIRLTNRPGALMEADGRILVHTSFTNAGGTVDIPAGGRLDAHLINYYQTSGTTILAGGQLVIDTVTRSSLIDGGFFDAWGSHSGRVNIGPAGTLRVGGPGATGTLNVTGNYLQSGTVEIEVGGTSASGDFDQVIISGSRLESGTLRVLMVGGYDDPCCVYTIMSSAVATGNTFTTIELPSLCCSKNFVFMRNGALVNLAVSISD